MDNDDPALSLVQGLVRLVDQVGSYVDARAALSVIVRGLVSDLGLQAASIWREKSPGLELICAEGDAIDESFARSALGGPVIREGREIAHSLRLGGLDYGVLATRGSVDEGAELLVGMLAGRCAHILRDSRRAEAQQILIRGLSHELRAPLQSLLGHLDLVRDGTLGALNEDQEQALAQVAAGAERVLSVCIDVLQVARIDSGHEAVIVGEVALDRLLADEVEQVRPLADRAGLELGLECPAGLRIVSDGAKLARIVTNLLSNAVKYTERGSVRVRAWRAGGTRVVVEVSDTGPGIPADRHREVFCEYVRLDPSREGAGLGLPIARRLAVLLGCRLELDSEPGRGTTIRLECNEANMAGRDC